MNTNIAKNRYFVEKEMSMEASNVRKEIHEYVDHADQRFLALVYSMVQADQESTIGYNTDGTPITKKDLVARAEASEQDIKAGRTKSLKTLREEVKSW